MGQTAYKEFEKVDFSSNFRYLTICLAVVVQVVFYLFHFFLTFKCFGIPLWVWITDPQGQDLQWNNNKILKSAFHARTPTNKYFPLSTVKSSNKQFLVFKNYRSISE